MTCHSLAYYSKLIMKGSVTAITVGLVTLAFVSIILPVIDTNLGLRKGSVYQFIMAAALLTALILAGCHLFKRK